MNLKNRLSNTKTVRRMVEFNRIAEIDALARRYFTLNSFDGILTTVAILLANFFADVTLRSIIVTSSIGAATAVAISGFYGAYITEKAERMGKIRKLENTIGLRLTKTQFEEAHTFAILALALIEGLSPFIISSLIVLPFFIMDSIEGAYYSAFSIAGLALFLLGIFLGKISKENLILSGIKMFIVGVVCTITVIIVEHLFRF